MSKRHTYSRSTQLLRVVDQLSGEVTLIPHTDLHRVTEPNPAQSGEAAIAQERRNARARQKRRAIRELDRLRALEPWRPESYWQQSSTGDE